jgi:hypothetical protein
VILGLIPTAALGQAAAFLRGWRYFGPFLYHLLSLGPDLPVNESEKETTETAQHMATAFRDEGLHSMRFAVTWLLYASAVDLLIYLSIP